MKHPQYKFNNNQVSLTGIIKAPLVLADLSERNQTAQANVEHALKQNNESTFFFIGIEHLPYLLKEWPEDKQAIVIEKSQSYAQDFAKHQRQK